jgi:protein-ribulosamine 3-kinase
MDFARIAAELRALTGLACELAPESAVAEGGRNRCYRWPAGRHTLFVKLAPLAGADALVAEAAGLAQLAAAGVLRVPRVFALGQADAQALLALEWLERVPADADSERRLGAGLAQLHAVTGAHFGWKRDNYIGATPQRNGASDDWAVFFREQRLRPQLTLLRGQGFVALSAGLEPLLERVARLLAGHHPAPALLHGDLWAGNWLTLAGAEPVVYDPAVYFGDRETDLAMTRLFGGFGPTFYRAYEAAAPLPPGAALRADLYNLYHVLNHANLFAGGYLQQAQALTERLLRAGSA